MQTRCSKLLLAIHAGTKNYISLRVLLEYNGL